MRIDRLEIENFKCFAKQTITLHPQFTLFVGENGSGKTSVLDALAVAASIWLVEPPDSSLNGSRREILENEIRLEAVTRGDRAQFLRHEPVSIEAFGHLGDTLPRSWIRQIHELDRPDRAEHRESGKIISEREFSFFSAVHNITERFLSDKNGTVGIFPIVVHYGTARAFSRPAPLDKSRSNGPARRWAAFRDCFTGRVNFEELTIWFRRETTERGNRGGRWRPGFEIVRQAILRCLPDADDVRFDSDRDEIVVSIGGNIQPLANLSDGQRMIVAMVADIAVRAVTQNAFLIPPDELGPEDEPVPQVLKRTPGLVLIDELDLHLHPKWQRHVADDLRAAFPAIQFVCTSHSPQIIGELKPEEIRVLSNNSSSVPARSFGMDSSRVLEELMDAPARNESVQILLDRIFDRIDREDLAGAKVLLTELKSTLSPDDAEVTRAEALMTFLEAAI